MRFREVRIDGEEIGDDAWPPSRRVDQVEPITLPQGHILEEGELEVDTRTEEANARVSSEVLGVDSMRGERGVDVRVGRERAWFDLHAVLPVVSLGDHNPPGSVADPRLDSHLDGGR